MNLLHYPRRAYDKYLVPYILHKRYRNVLDKNRDLKNLKRGRTCFILGNGPSLNDLDLTRLSQEETFVVNSFWQHPQYQDIKPKNYVLIDSDSFPKSEGETNACIEDLINRKTVISTHPTKLFFNIIGKNFIETQKLFPHNETYYLALYGFFTENLKFNICLDKILPNVKNVIVACIISAVYMGFERIYLLGCEHDFLAYPSTAHYEGFKHFYKTKQFDLSNKEEVRYYALAAHSYERHIDNVKTLFRNYRLLAWKLARTHPQVEIYNATPKSFLDIFPMVKFEDIPLTNA